MAEPKMRRSYKYKLRLNRRFRVACEQTLESCRQVYNAALEQRVTAHKAGRRTRYLEQCRQLTQARELPEVGAIARTFQANALKRLDTAYDGFFRRIKTHKGKAGFPRFKGYDRYDSFNTIDARAFRLDADKLTAFGLGSCRVRLSRSLAGRPKTLTIRREADGWYAVIGCDNVEPRVLPQVQQSVGVDVGLESFATLSTGKTISNPRFFQKGAERLANAQQRLALKTRGSQSRKRARRLVAKAHAKIQRQRDWFHWQQARALVFRYDLIAVEDLNVKGMAQGNLAKSIHDAGWALFITKLLVKAEEAAREVVKVSARFTSQDCSGCGKRQKKELSERWHSCECGVSLSRDHNAAINILARAGPSLKTKLAKAGS